MASSSAIDETFRSDQIEEDEDDREIGVSNSYSSYSSCGSCLFGIGSRRNRSRYVPLKPPDRLGDEEAKQSWMVKKVRRFKEFIKAMAARKWRSFINEIINKRRTVRFQYDPTSYALNFDEGGGGDGRGRDFSPPSVSPIGMNRTEIG